MNKITKILNHNAILVHAQKTNEKLLIMHKGIGFGRNINEMIELDTYDAMYHLQSGMNAKDDQLLNKLDSIYIEISHTILSAYLSKFDRLDESKLLPLADHIAFAVQRIQSNLSISNPFTNEIRLLYPEEWSIAATSRELIFNKLGCLINDDEISYITLHLNSTQELSKDHGFIVAMILKESIAEIETTYDIKVDGHSLSYSRLMMHMKYMIARLNEDEVLTLDMEDYTKQSIPTAYTVAQRIVDRITLALNKDVPSIETGYLAMHVDRILSESPTYQNSF